MTLDGIRFLQEYLAKPEKFLPLVDHAWKVFPKRSEFGDVNIGWNAGLIENNRPYFCECWAEGFTMLTYFISAKGIEDYSVEQMEAMLHKAGIVWFKQPQKDKIAVQPFTDSTGNAFFSVNLVVGDDEATYTEDGIIYSFNSLNDFNKGRNHQLQ